MPQYDATADGQRFLMVRDVVDLEREAGGVAPGIQIVLNWVEELKRLVPTD